jgi:hypothetical protein
MSEQTSPPDDLATTEEQARMNSREHLWRQALWAGFAHQEMLVKDLQGGKMPWVHDFAPLNREERVFSVGALCKSWFPDMTEEAEKECFQYLGQLYGVQNSLKRMKQRKKVMDRIIDWRMRHGH